MIDRAAIAIEDFRTLFAHLPDATLLIDPYDPEGRWPIVACNAAACHMNGYAYHELVGQPLDMLNLRPSSPTGRASFLQRIRNEGTIYGRNRHRCKDGTVVPIEYSATFVTIGGRELIISTDRDVSHRVLTEAALHDSDTRFRTIFEESPTGMAIIDLDYRFQRVNRAFCDILGYTEQELTGMSVTDITHPEDADHSELLARQLLDGTRSDYVVEKRYITKQRKVIWGRLTSALLRDREGQPLAGLGIVENITGRKRTDLLLEAERRRVAYELHDSLAQVLASTHFRLQALASRYRPRAPEARADLKQALELARRAVREARRIIAGLRPTALDDFGLAVALQKEVDARATAGWDISFEAKLGGECLPPAAETALFWVAQEALTNIRKHAGPTHVRISLGIEDGDICLEIQDWGVGFDPMAPTTRHDPGEQIGLLGMQERVAVLGGVCEVQSQPGAGTRIVAQVPLRLPSSMDGLDAFSNI